MSDVSTRMPTRRGWAVALGVGVVAVVAVVLGLFLLGDEPPLPGIRRDPPLRAVGLEFVDHADGGAGATVDLVPPEGELTLAYFGYLSCPDVCPTTMADLRWAFQGLDPATVAQLTVAFVTVDPDRDTGAEIRDYLDLFFADQQVDLAALRADGPTDLDEAADQLGVSYQVADHEPGAERYDVAHSAITYVIDDTGTVVRELPFGATPEEFARVVRAALDT